MAENKKSFLLYCDQIHTVSLLSNDQAGQLFKLILSYVNDENPEPDTELMRVVFEPFKQQLKRDLRKYTEKQAKNKENAMKRWNATASDPMRADANYADKVKGTDIDTVTDTDKGIIKEKGEMSFDDFIDAVYKRDKYKPEMLEEFIDYWTAKGEKERKMRFQKEKLFDIDRRLTTWYRRMIAWDKPEPDKSDLFKRFG